MSAAPGPTPGPPADMGNKSTVSSRRTARWPLMFRHRSWHFSAMEREPHDTPSPDLGPPAPDGPAATGFVWPPKPLPPDPPRPAQSQPGDPAPPFRQAPARPEHPPPPNPASHPAHRLDHQEPASPVEAAPAAHRFRITRLLAQLEDALLEPEHLSLARRAMQTGWLPDPPHVYCNRCGETVGPHEGDGHACRSCTNRKLHYTRFYRLGTLDAELRAWIYEIKFARGHRMARSLGALLATRIAVSIAGSAPSPNRPFVVVPVPTTHRRRIARGIDHSAHIAAGIADQLGSPVRRLLARRHTRPQRGLPRSARADNIRGAIKTRSAIATLASPQPDPSRAGTPAPIILLVDDVRTTGATLHACAAAIRGAFARSAPPEIWAACLAVAEPGRD